MQSKILSPVRMPVQSLVPLQGDFKTLGKKQFAKLKNSIKKNGFIQPFFVWGNKILDGHQRQKAIIDLYGNIEVDCLQIDAKDELEAKKLCIYYASSYATFDKESFMAFADGLNFDDIEDFEFPGLKITEDDFIDVVDKEEDEIPDVVYNELGVQLEDIYQLGDHRLMCGDSTNLKMVQILMGGQKADMVFTDPPYSVNYEKKNKEILKSQSYSKIENDNLSVDDIAKNIWKPVFSNMASVSNDSASIYATMPQGGDQMMMMMMMDDWKVKHELIWLKESPVFSMGRLDYDYMHEPIIYGWKKTHNFYGSGKFKKSVWLIERDGDKSHPTMKPVKLIENAVQNSSKQGNVVIDFFGGSGSTLIACEKTKRKCYMMELDPHYCSVIIKRWEKYSGKKAIKM